MASSVGSSAARGVGQAIGKPIGSLSKPQHGDINWVNFNYPPLICLIHWDSSELPSSLTNLVCCFNYSFVITCFACSLNLLNMIIIVSSTRAPVRWIIESVLHLVMLPPAALAVFYSGYRGLAEPDGQLTWRFKALQPILAFTYLLLAVVPWGCANGLAKLGRVGEFTDGFVYWTIVIFVESALWLMNACLAGTNAVRCHHFDPHCIGAGGLGNTF